MNILLISMPDTVSALNAIARIPNLGLCSLAAHRDGDTVRILDLPLQSGRLGPLVEKAVRELDPDLVGLTAMSFQYKSAVYVARLVKRVKPGVKTVLGGYHATLLAGDITASAPGEAPFDFFVRGEGEAAFPRLARALRESDGFRDVPGLSWCDHGTWTHNPPAALLEPAAVRLPDREARLPGRSRFIGLRFDCAETSRGCTMGCAFCSIRKMYGRSIRYFPLDRVMEDLERMRRAGTQGVFFVDDNITLNVPRLKELCRRIITGGYSSLRYVIQASVAGIASDPELPGLLDRANVRWIFLGIESGNAASLQAMHKTGVYDNTRTAVERLRRRGICVIGGFIVGNPGDSRREIRDTYRFARSLRVDHAIVQILTPYPETGTRETLLRRGLVTNPDRFERYNGFMANVRTQALSAPRLEFWNTLYGLTLYFNPLYMARSRVWWYLPGNAPQMLANNFRFLFSGLRGRTFRSRHRW